MDQIVIKSISSDMTFTNRVDHILARLGINRSGHCVEPGLYSLGKPDSDSPVFVTANYTLSFDALRSALMGQDGYILVLDTKGINVWCAAGKGTFNMEEMVRKIVETGLPQVVRHRKLILPQLGAPGVAAHKVKKQSGFNIEYGPVRAKDLPEYLKTHKATAEMREVKFTLTDRLILVPVEVIHMILPMLIIAILFYFIGGFLGTLGVALAMIAGVVIFPILLPWIPTHNFSTKGFVLGGLLALILIFIRFFGTAGVELWPNIGWALVYLLLIPSITAFLTLNFTGTTTFTSRSGVKREIFTYFPAMAWMFGIGVLLSISITLIKLFMA